MIEMFRYLTGILDEKEQKIWKIYAVLSLISPIVDIFSFSVIIYIINIVVLLRYLWCWFLFSKDYLSCIRARSPIGLSMTGRRSCP